MTGELALPDWGFEGKAGSRHASHCASTWGTARKFGRTCVEASSLAQNDGKYILVIEGSIPMKDAGDYLQIGGFRGIQRILLGPDPRAA